MQSFSVASKTRCHLDFWANLKKSNGRIYELFAVVLCYLITILERFLKLMTLPYTGEAWALRATVTNEENHHRTKRKFMKQRPPLLPGGQKRGFPVKTDSLQTG